jgi:hypothetical protein
MPKNNTPRVVMAAIRRALPSYRLLDAGRVFDIFGGLCSIEVRAVDRNGSTLVLLSTGARHAAQLQTSVRVGRRLSAAIRVARADLVLPMGWRITLGAIGPAADQPRAAELLRLAHDPALRW